MKKTILVLIGFAFIVGVTSCKKKGCTDPTATNYKIEATKDDGSCEFKKEDDTQVSAPTYTPHYDGEFAALVALKTITTMTAPIIGEYDTEIGTAVAVFSQDGANTFISAGNVDLEGSVLSVQSNHSYVYQITASQPNGITLGGNITWAGAGSTWPAFTATTNQGFSTIGGITTGDVSASSNYTLTASSVSNADSVLFMLAGKDNNIIKILPSGTTSHTFSASEVSSVGKGTGIIQVVGLNYDIQSIGTPAKDYYLINETVRSKIIKIQ